MSIWNDKDRNLFSGTAFAAPRCYESHPPLKLGTGTLSGGSAAYPKVTADVYVALDAGSTCGRISDPWDPPKVIEIQYGITDMHAPTDVKRFKKLITYLCEQLQAGKRVHVGCVGGHGRTGTVISAIVAQLTGEKDAIQWVRKHYCERAVESQAQVQFLMKHFGVSKVRGHKDNVVRAFTRRDPLDGDLPVQSPAGFKANGGPYTPSFDTGVRRVVPPGVTGQTKSYLPLKSSRSLWIPRI